MFDYVFQVRPFWDEMNVPKQKVERRYQKFFGKENLTIENRQEATSLLLRVVTELQNEILKCFCILSMTVRGNQTHAGTFSCSWIRKAPSMAPSTIGKYSSGQSCSLWLTL